MTPPFKHFRVDRRKVIEWILIIAIFTIPLVIYLNRFLLPDTSGDVFLYHLFNGARGIQNWGWPFSVNEFYPLGFANVSPLFDILNYIVRSLAGYRLGTIVSLVAYWLIIWVALRLAREVGYNLRRMHPIIFYLLTANAVIVTGLVFQVATYFVDILTASLIMILILLVLQSVKKPSPWQFYISSAIIGIVLAGKITAIAFVLPILLVMAWSYLRYTYGKKIEISSILIVVICMLLVIAPSFFYGFQNWSRTGNPFFTFYNNIFHSQYYPSVGFTNDTGGTTKIEKLFWPVTWLENPSRLGVPYAFFSDLKLPFTWLTSISVLVLYFRKKKRRSGAIVLLASITFISFTVWSLVFGAERYISVAIILGGILLIPLVELLYDGLAHRRPIIKLGSLFLLVAILSFITWQNVNILKFALTTDMSARRTLISNSQLHLAQIPFLAENKLQLKEAEGAVLEADIFLNCNERASGLIALIDASIPTVQISDHPLYRMMTDDRDYQAKVKSLLGSNPDQTFTFAAFALKDNLYFYDSCQTAITSHGGTIENEIEISNFLGNELQPVVVFLGKIKLFP